VASTPTEAEGGEGPQRGLHPPSHYTGEGGAAVRE